MTACHRCGEATRSGSTYRSTAGETYGACCADDVYLADLTVLHGEWSGSDSPPERFLYLLGRWCDEKRLELTRRHFSRQASGFRKLDDGLEMQVERHPYAIVNGQVGRIVLQKWRVTLVPTGLVLELLGEE